MKVIKLECLLMDNGEILFKGRSLGFISKEEFEEYAGVEQSNEETKK